MLLFILFSRGINLKYNKRPTYPYICQLQLILSDVISPNNLKSRTVLTIVSVEFIESKTKS